MVEGEPRSTTPRAALGAESQRALVIALLVSLVLWNLPHGGFLLFPFKLFATWLHESSHGIVMLLSGAGFEKLDIYADTSGSAHARYPVGQAARAAIASAGYVGTAAMGATLLVIAQTRTRARAALGALALLMALTTLFWIDNDFGRVSIGIWAAVCAGFAIFASENVAVFSVSFLAAQACANSLLDIRVLFRDNQVVNGKIVGNSDAHNMARAAFGSPKFWAVVWLLWSLLLLYLALRLLHQRQVAAQLDEASATSK